MATEVQLASSDRTRLSWAWPVLLFLFAAFVSSGEALSQEAKNGAVVGKLTTKDATLFSRAPKLPLNLKELKWFLRHVDSR